MGRVIRELPAEVPPIRPDRDPDEEPTAHPMRRATSDASRGTWDAAQARDVARYFDELAPGWDERPHADRHGPLADAFARGGPVPGGRCAEVGSGTGELTAALAERFDLVVALELSPEMLRRAPARPGHRVRADGAALPLPDRSVDCVALINAFLFPAEVARVLAPGGRLVWVNSSGCFTPIHLGVAELADALGPRWNGVASSHGDGTWAVLQQNERP